MNNSKKPITLSYDQVYTNYPKYRYFYFDILNNKLTNNSSVMYPIYDKDTKESTLCMGRIVLKDHSIIELRNDIEIEIVFKSVPFIRTNNGSLILNNNKNCISI